MRYRVEDELRFIELSARLSLARAGDPRIRMEPPTVAAPAPSPERTESLAVSNPIHEEAPARPPIAHDDVAIWRSSIDMKRGRRSSVGPESIGDEVQIGELGLVVAG